MGIRLIVFLFLDENVCCGYSLEAPCWGTSNEYPQHMFSSRNKKNTDTFWLKKAPYQELWTLYFLAVVHIFCICMFVFRLSSSYIPSTKEPYLRIWVASEDSDQHAHLRSLVRIYTGCILDSQRCKFLHADKEDSDQIGQMHRLIWVIVGCIYVGRYIVSHRSSNG